jgi:hypothetical protein
MKKTLIRVDLFIRINLCSGWREPSLSIPSSSPDFRPKGVK